MALPALILDGLRPVLAQIERGGCASRTVCSLGYPDILASSAQLRAIFGEPFAASIQYRADSAEILRYHRAERLADRVPDAVSLFGQLGYQLEVIDLVAARGGEIIHDLNVPVPEKLEQRYALVIDSGTCEHCFDIAQAATNLAKMTALGGAVIQSNPLNMFNHGFYNLNPTWYFDFYEQNGFVIDFMRVVSNPVFDPRLVEVPPYKRFAGMPDNCTLLVIARRVELKPIRRPVQKKYRDNPTLRG